VSQRKKVKLPRINLDEIKKDIERNFKQRLEFIEEYVEWLKKTNNVVWSEQQKKDNKKIIISF